MRIYIASLLLLCSLCTVSQEVENDSSQIVKSTTIAKERSFDENINDKYSNDKDFQYKEYEAPKPKEKSNLDLSAIGAIVVFLGQVLPWFIGAIVLYIILKTVFDLDVNFWKKKSNTKKVAKKLIYEDDDIHEVDLHKFLKESLENQNYRLAVRYYYLLILRGLSSKKMIDYHKDKTNAEYLFEIKEEKLRTQFSTLSYIYTYVWYGEFLVDEISFKKAEKQYQSFLTKLT